MTSGVWHLFRQHLASRGYLVLAPPWPRLRGAPECIRECPEILNGLGISEITRYYAKLVRSLHACPILIGHALGGLVVQKLLDQGLGAAGVALCSMPPKSVPFRQSYLPQCWSRILANPLNAGRAVRLSPDEFRSSFSNSLSSVEADEVFERIILPAPGRTIFELALANINNRTETQVSFAPSTRTPLLFVGGEQDRLVPPVLVRAMFERYANSGAMTEMRIFADRCHLIGSAGCDEVAEFTAAWIQSVFKV